MSWGAVAGAAIGVVGGSLASKSASKGQQKATDASIAAQERMFEQTREDQAPYREAGYSALSELQKLLGLAPAAGAGVEDQAVVRERMRAKFRGKGLSEEEFTRQVSLATNAEMNRQRTAAQSATRAMQADPKYGMLTRQFTGDDLENDPGYQFHLNEGNQAVERSASARGGLYSGATLKALQKYGQDYAGTKFNEAYNRDASYKDSLFNRLSGVSGTGQTATNQVGAAGSAYANNVGNLLTNQANASGAASMARANIISGGINQGLSAWLRGSGGGTSGANWASTGGGWGSGNAYGNEDLGASFSDARLKTNIRRIGTSQKGHGWYRWDWKTGGSAEGVIAQEVAAVDPSAVSADADGILRVDYSRV